MGGIGLRHSDFGGSKGKGLTTYPRPTNGRVCRVELVLNRLGHWGLRGVVRDGAQ